MDYALQRFERDHITSKGGTWNQLLLSNIPIALGAVGVIAAIRSVPSPGLGAGYCSSSNAGMTSMAIAIVLGGILTAVNWPGWSRFLNPRWLAHSVREIATYPLTAIPTALAGVMIVEVCLSGTGFLNVRIGPETIGLAGAGVGLLMVQLLLLKNVDITAIAQKPAFARKGRLPVPYLLSSHVFEHVLDFVLIGPLSGGIYAWLRSTAE